MSFKASWLDTAAIHYFPDFFGYEMHYALRNKEDWGSFQTLAAKMQGTKKNTCNIIVIF